MGTEIVQRANWNFDVPVPDQPMFPDVIAQSRKQAVREEHDGRPQFTAEDLALIAPGDATAAGDAAPLFDGFEESEVAAFRRHLASGLFTPTDLGLHYGLSDAELEALQQSAGDGPRNTAPAQASALERSDGEDLDPELRSEWEKQGGVAYHLGLAQRAVEAMVEGMAEAERSAFMTGFEALPAAAVNTVYQFLALEPGRASQPASDAQLETFAAHGEACAAVVKAWSAAAGRKYATAEARIDMILNAMSDADADATEAWFAALPPPQKAAVVNALAGA